MWGLSISFVGFEKLRVTLGVECDGIFSGSREK